MAGAMPTRIAHDVESPQPPERWRPVYTAVVVTLVMMLIGLGLFSSHFSG